MSSITEFAAPLGRSAVLDEAYRRAPSPAGAATRRSSEEGAKLLRAGHGHERCRKGGSGRSPPTPRRRCERSGMRPSR